jgi:hypothetical protein
MNRKYQKKEDTISFILFLIFAIPASISLSLAGIIFVIDNFSIIFSLIFFETLAQFIGILWLIRYVRKIHKEVR